MLSATAFTAPAAQAFQPLQPTMTWNKVSEGVYASTLRSGLTVTITATAYHASKITVNDKAGRLDHSGRRRHGWARW